MTFYPTYLWTLLLVITFFTACVMPQPVSRLVPLEENNKWWYGRQIIELPENDGVTMDLIFQKSTPQYLILDVSIQNRSDQTVLVDPLQFYMVPLERDTLRSVAPPIVALNPEIVLLNLDRSESREIAEAQNSAYLEILSLTLDLASDISSIGEDEDSEVRAQELEEREIRREDYEVEQVNRDYRLGSLDEQRDYWENASIRKTSLDPGYELKGSLFFSRENKASFFLFHGAIEGRAFQVLFRQRLYQS